MLFLCQPLHYSENNESIDWYHLQWIYVTLFYIKNVVNKNISHNMNFFKWIIWQSDGTHEAVRDCYINFCLL